MVLDPQAKEYLEIIKAKNIPPLSKMTVEENRTNMSANKSLSGPAEEVAKVENIAIPVTDGEITVRIYTPEGVGPFPVLVYFHGGGWVLGDLDLFDAPLRAVANRAEFMVVSVDYRLAPEYKFPVATEDCYAATKWVFENIVHYNGDHRHIAIGGDSAGGNLAATVTLMTKERGGPSIVQQVLIYPATDFTFQAASLEENGEGYMLTKDSIEWFAKHYLSDEQKTLPHASPLLAPDLSGLPPALVITAEYDPLRDEGEAYAHRLMEAGVEVELKRYDGMIHGFFRMAGIIDQGKQLIEQVSHYLKESYEAKW